jgi:hypothetical protein
MAADPVSALERAPHRARYLIPRELPHRAEVVATLGVLALLAHLLLAQVTITLAVVFHGVSRISRWRPQWLLVPAAGGLGWVLATGPAAALAGFTAGPRALAGLLAALITDPARLARLATAAGQPQRWLPGQLPVALIAGAAEAAVARWAGWLHTDEWDLAPARPGLIVLGRQWLNRMQLRSGGMVTRDGTCLGLDRRSGRRAVVSWREAEGGVLVTGGSWAQVSATGCQLLHAAIRRRKPVIAVDLAGDPAFAASLTAACAASDAPLRVFGGGAPAAAGDGAGSPGNPGYYEPLQGGSPARKASLIVGMIDWTGRPETARQEAAAVLTDIFAVAAAAPAGPGAAVADDVIRLLDPAALRARLARVPLYHPRRASLAERVRTSAARLESDPEPAALVAGQLGALRAAPAGQWLAPGPSAGQRGARISLGAVVRDRGVALFPLGGAASGRPAEMIATLVALDAAGVFTDLHRTGVAGDGVAWFGPCEAADPAALAALLAAGSQAGLACVLATTAAQLAGTLAGQVRVLAGHRLDDPGLAALIAPLTGTRLARADGMAGPAPAAGLPAAALPGAALPGAALPGAASTAGLAAAAPGSPAASLPATAPLAAGPLAAGPLAAGPPGAAPLTRLPPAAAPPPAATQAGYPAGAVTGMAAGVAAPFGVTWAPVVPAGALCALRDDEFTLVVGPPGRRVIPLARAVPGRIPQPRPVRPARLARLSGPAQGGTAGAGGPGLPGGLSSAARPALLARLARLARPVRSGRAGAGGQR